LRASAGRAHAGDETRDVNGLGNVVRADDRRAGERTNRRDGK
jgi:hypothetical protein